MDNQNIEFLRTFPHRTIKMAAHTLDVTGDTVNLFDPISQQYSIWVETGTVTTLTAANYYTVVIEESKDGVAWATTDPENLDYDKDWTEGSEGILNDDNADSDTFRSIGYARNVAEIKYIRVNLVKTGSPSTEAQAFVLKHKLHTSRDPGEVVLKYEL